MNANDRNKIRKIERETETLKPAENADSLTTITTIGSFQTPKKDATGRDTSKPSKDFIPRWG